MQRLPPRLKLDADFARRLVEAQFPQWTGLPIRPVMHMGWDNRTFRLGEDMAVRLPSASVYASQVAREHRWLPMLAPHLPLPIPRPIAMGQPCQDYPWHWSIYGWLPGEPLSARNVSDTEQLARCLGDFLRALQRIDTDGGPPPGPDNFHRGGDLRVYDVETRRALSILDGRIDAPAATRVWEAAVDSAHSGPPLWVHGDVSFPNLLVRHGRLAGVIDFGCMAVGDPACDLAVAWSWVNPETRRAFRSALPFDDDSWARARGWAVWKALVVIAGISAAHPAGREQASHALQEVLADDGSNAA